MLCRVDRRRGARRRCVLRFCRSLRLKRDLAGEVCEREGGHGDESQYIRACRLAV